MDETVPPGAAASDVLCDIAPAVAAMDRCGRGKWDRIDCAVATVAEVERLQGKAWRAVRRRQFDSALELLDAAEALLNHGFFLDDVATTDAELHASVARRRQRSVSLLMEFEAARIEAEAEAETEAASSSFAVNLAVGTVAATVASLAADVPAPRVPCPPPGENSRRPQRGAGGSDEARDPSFGKRRVSGLDGLPHCPHRAATDSEPSATSPTSEARPPSQGRMKRVHDGFVCDDFAPSPQSRTVGTPSDTVSAAAAAADARVSEIVALHEADLEQRALESRRKLFTTDAVALTPERSVLDGMSAEAIERAVRGEGLREYQAGQYWVAAFKIQAWVRMCRAKDTIRAKQAAVERYVREREAGLIILTLLRCNVARKFYARRVRMYNHTIQGRVAEERAQFPHQFPHQPTTPAGSPMVGLDEALFSAEASQSRDTNFMDTLSQRPKSMSWRRTSFTMSALAKMKARASRGPKSPPNSRKMPTLERQLQCVQMIQEAWRNFVLRRREKERQEAMIYMRYVCGLADMPFADSQDASRVSLGSGGPDSDLGTRQQLNGEDRRPFAPLVRHSLRKIQAEEARREEEQQRQREKKSKEERRQRRTDESELQKKIQSAQLIQRVCRGYPRRFFLAAKLAVSAGRQPVVKGGVAVLPRRQGHFQRQAPQTTEEVIFAIIAKSNPMLIPECRAEFERTQHAALSRVQATLRAKLSEALALAIRRFHAARRLQRRWRLWHVRQAAH